MNFKTNGLGKHTIVIFEYVYDSKGNLVGSEADFDAKSQMIYIDVDNGTGDRTALFLFILACVLALGVVTTCVTINVKKHR